MARPSIEQRFWSKVDKSGECWLWTACLSSNGYGQFKPVSHRRQKAHRFVWELTHGQIPNGLCVCHHCDHPSCVNPAHLFLGTHGENMADRDHKGRQSRSPKKLTDADVLAIRSDIRNQRRIATDYGIDQTSVSHIKRRITWGWLP